MTELHKDPEQDKKWKGALMEMKRFQDEVDQEWGKPLPKPILVRMLNFFMNIFRKFVYEKMKGMFMSRIYRDAKGYDAEFYNGEVRRKYFASPEEELEDGFIYSEADDRYFDDEEELIDYCIDEEIEDIDDLLLRPVDFEEGKMIPSLNRIADVDREYLQKKLDMMYKKIEERK